jgi:hypothetical protein
MQSYSRMFISVLDVDVAKLTLTVLSSESVSFLKYESLNVSAYNRLFFHLSNFFCSGSV